VRGEVAILFTDDRTIRKLNKRFRRKDKPTDVLSFPSALPGFAGDLAISMDTAARQAKRLGHSLDSELRVLLLHGLMHLAGYDHETDNGRMRRREAVLRRKFRLPASLTERVALPAPAMKRKRTK